MKNINNYLSPVELSVLYGVSLETVNNGIQNGDLAETEGKISLKDFRAWCITHRIESKKIKVCTNCKTELPAYHFGRHSNHPDGLEYRCLECDREQDKKRRATPTNNKDSLFEMGLTPEKVALSIFAKSYHLTNEEIVRLYTFFMRREVTRFSLVTNDILIDKKSAEWFILGAFNFKRCPHCGRIKRYSEFYTNNSFWNKIQSWCKECALTYGKNAREEATLSKQADAELRALLAKYPRLKNKVKFNQTATL